MAKKTRKKRKVVTDKIVAMPANVTDMRLDHVEAAYAVYHKSFILSQITWYTDMLKSGTKFNTIEIEAVDRFIKLYNVMHKSPLAKAMTEE